MREVQCSTENSPHLKIDHIHAKINRVCCAALAIGKRCMNVRKNKLLGYNSTNECYVIIITFSINHTLWRNIENSHKMIIFYQLHIQPHIYPLLCICFGAT